MHNVERYIKRAKLPKNKSMVDDQLNLLDLRILIDGKYKKITDDIIEEVNDGILDEDSDDEYGPTFCTSGSGDGIPEDYLSYYFNDKGHSSLVYFTKNTRELIAVLSYNYDMLLNAMHIIAFCVNRQKRFQINGHHIMNDIKDIMRNSNISTIILEAVPSSKKFYHNQGFKSDHMRHDSDNVPMISHYRIRSNGEEEWSYNSFKPTTKPSSGVRQPAVSQPVVSQLAVSQGSVKLTNDIVDNRGTKSELPKVTIIHLDIKNKNKDKTIIIDVNLLSRAKMIRAKSLSIGLRNNGVKTNTKTKLKRANSMGSPRRTRKSRH
jgi:hypothetical protein